MSATPKEEETKALILRAFDTLFNQRDYVGADWRGAQSTPARPAQVAM